MNRICFRPVVGREPILVSFPFHQSFSIEGVAFHRTFRAKPIRRSPRGQNGFTKPYPPSTVRYTHGEWYLNRMCHSYLRHFAAHFALPVLWLPVPPTPFARPRGRCKISRPLAFPEETPVCRLSTVTGVTILCGLCFPLTQHHPVAPLYISLMGTMQSKRQYASWKTSLMFQLGVLQPWIRNLLVRNLLLYPFPSHNVESQRRPPRAKIWRLAVGQRR